MSDVVIIGAGVIGCSIAVELSRRGHNTVNLERGPAAGCGSTMSSSAVIRTSYSTPTGVNFSYEGVQYWRNWAEHIGVDDELGLVQFRDCGQLMMLTDPTDYSHKVKALWEALDVPFETLSLDDLAHRFPWMDTGRFGPPTVPDDDAFWDDTWGHISGAILTPDAGYVSDPQLAAHNLQHATEAAGGRFQFGATVTVVDQSNEAVRGVTLGDGTAISADIVINCAGPHSPVINKMADVFDAMQIKTAPMRQEVHHLPGPDVDYQERGVVMADDDLGFYSRPEVGGNMLLGGIEAACDVLEWLDDADDFSPLVSDYWETQVLRANRRFPDLGVPHQRQGTAGVYDVSDDWVPIYDRTDLAGFYVAIGTSGNQFKNAGSSGHVMAELIEAVEAGHDHDAEPLQIAGAFTGRIIDMGAFSRNREISHTSMSVNG